MSEVRSMEFGPAVAGLRAGKRCFGRFRLDRPLGRGRFTAAWVARDTMAETDLVLKFLPTALAGDKALLGELAGECRRLAGFQHQAVARTMNLWVEGPLAAISTELVDGDSLAQLMGTRSNRVLEEPELAAWVGRICSTLEVAHERMHLVHHDLQVSQVLVERRGSVRVTDFGTAALLRNAAARASGTASLLGSCPRLSPQQLMGETPSVADDIYAMGSLLYEALTGQPPFFGGDIAERVRAEVPPSITQRRQELGVAGQLVSPAWEAAIAACLAKEPVRRPQSARLLAGALGVHCPEVDTVFVSSAETEAVVASPAPAPVVAPRGFRWGNWIVPGVIGGAVVVAGLVVWSSGGLRGTRGGPAATTAAAQVAAPVVPGRGGVVVRTNPDGADIRVGTVILQKAPVTVSDLEEGEYPIRVQMPGYEEWTGTVEVKRNVFAQVQVDLVPQTGSIRIESDPEGADVWETLETKQTFLRGKTPLVLEKRPIGATSFALRMDGRVPKTVAGEVLANDMLVLRTSLPPWAGPKEGQNWTVPGVGSTLVWLPPSCVHSYRFVSENNTARYRAGGWPDLGIWVGETEVTQSQWRALMAYNPSQHLGATYPVESVTFKEVQEFCAKLTEQERAAGRLPDGYSYSLPTDDEWAYACGAGSGRSFPGGEELENLGWYRGNSDGALHSVRRKKPNPWGMYDMHGNVYEFTRSGRIRGGSFRSDAQECTSGTSSIHGREPRYDSVGFRLALCPESRR